MPRSIFMGRPMPAPGEPLWLPEDRAYAMALLENEADTCPDCGQPWSESSDPAAAEGVGYEVDVVRCHACAAAAKAVSAHQHGKGEMAGLHIEIRKRR